MGSPFFKEEISIMKKFFLFIAAVATLSLVSCSGSDASSTTDGQSLDPGIDPNAPSAQPPQVSNAAPSVEENTTNSPEVSKQDNGVDANAATSHPSQEEKNSSN